jgi:hypothetical protein
VPRECESSRHLYQVTVENSNEVILALNAHQVHPGVHCRPTPSTECMDTGEIRVLTLDRLANA